MAGKKRARPDKEVSKEVEDTEDAVHESASADQEEDVPPADDEEVEHDGSKKARKRKRKRKKASGAEEGDEQDGDGEDDESTTGQQTKDSGDGPFTAYVEGISYEATEDDVQAFFQDKGCGKVLEVRMPRYQDSGRPRGYAHLDFKKAESLEKAIGLNGQYLMGRYLKVQKANETAQPRQDATRTKPPGCRTVFVKNLPYELTEDEVREAFTFCGKIANVRLAIWNHTKAKKGFGYVDFVKEESAEIAVKKQGTIRVKGRLVAIDYESGKPKGSFRTEDGRNWKKVAGKPTK